MCSHDGSGPCARIEQQRRDQPCVPVVRMDEIRNEGGHKALPYAGSGLRKRGETDRVIRPVTAVRPPIGIACSVIEMRSIEHEEVEACDRAGDEPRGAAEQVGEGLDRLGHGKLCDERRIARDQRADSKAFARQSGRERTSHVREPPGFD